MHVDLSDTTVLVTGASRGIGRAIARECAASGARVAAHYVRSSTEAASLQAEAPDRIHLFQADLTDLDACGELFHAVVDRLGGLDVLVNNAGVALPLPLDADADTWRAGWEETMHVNVRAAEYLCRLAIGHFTEHRTERRTEHPTERRTERLTDRRGGRIINIASRAAFRGDVPAYMTYAASKGALVALTRSIASGCGEAGVRAFVVAPGFVRTDMARDFIDAYGEDHVLEGIATDRLTEPEDVAPIVVFLASGRADHATGSTIDVNAASYIR
ncbi:MAG: SDR family oxidoreductase [Rhodothermales bacterium]